MTNDQTVTQADRDAAAAYLDNHGYWFVDPEDYITGKMDGEPLVQAFARHRTAHSGEGRGHPLSRYVQHLPACKLKMRMGGRCDCGLSDLRHSSEGRSNGAGEIEAGLVERFRSALRFAASHSVISSADEQALLAALAAPPASEAGMRVALEKATARFEAINNFGDPYEIAENPEDFGGTDDGGETVCMAYENMQGIAAAGARECRAALAQPEAGGER